MEDIIDTRSIPFDKPISDGFRKMAPNVALEDEASLIDEVPNEEATDYRVVIHDTETKSRDANYLEWFIIATRNLFVSALAATQINFLRLSTDNQWTSTFDMDTIRQIAPQKYHFMVTISPELVMPRKEVKNSSLLGPSGAYLCWLEMFEDGRDDRN